jgi:hypothetical protein
MGELRTGDRQRPSWAQRCARCCAGVRILFSPPDVVRVKCSPDDTVGDLKKLIAAQTGTDSSKIVLKKWCVTLLLRLSISLRDPSQVHDLQGPYHAR